MKNSNDRVPNNPDEVSPISAFLWWLATAEKELISDAVVDRNRFRIIGLSVLCTWIFATLAWTYFFTTIMENDLMALLPGFFMGFVILSIDRALIKGINKKNKRKFTAFAFRAVLALTIGMFMAQPAILYIFDKEIKMQTSLDNEGRKIQKKKELDARYAPALQTLYAEKTSIQNQLTEKYNEVNQARANFLAESDGSGGTGKIGISTIALAKKQEYEKLHAEYLTLKTHLDKKTDSADAGIQRIRADIQQEENIFASYLNDGFLTRIEALENLLKSNPALQNRYYLIVFILVLIELMPVIAKSALPSGTYEARVELQEEMEKELAQLEFGNNTDLRKQIIQHSTDSDKEFAEEFFKESKAQRTERMHQMNRQWQEDGSESFSGLWNRVRKHVMFRF